MSKLALPKVTVTLGDDTEHTVQTILADSIAWDVTRGKHKWPAMGDAPMMWIAFLGWHALRRTGAISTDTTWEKFSSEVVNVVSDDDPEPVDPTRPGATPGS